MNEILFVLETILCFLTLVYLYKKQKKAGLFVFMVLALVLGNIVSLKAITVFGLEVNLGIPIYTSIFVAFNMYIQKYGKDDILKIILTLMITAIISSVFLIVGVQYEDSNLQTSINVFFNRVFLTDMKMVFATLISLLVSLFVAGNVYYSVRKEQNKIIISNILTMIVVQFLDTIIFVTLFYAGDYDVRTIVTMFISRYVLKLVIGFIGTIPMYVTNSID